MSRAVRLLRDQRGAAMIEFAFVAPILIVFYIGMAELCQGLMAERKAAHAASAVADLVAQTDETTPAGVQAVLGIAPAILAPFSTGQTEAGDERLKIRVSSVQVDKNDKPLVRWSENLHWNDYRDGHEVDLPEVPTATGEKDFIAKGESVIMTEVEYAFNTPFSDMFSSIQRYVFGSATIHDGGYTFQSTYYLRPRRSDEVTCKDC